MFRIRKQFKIEMAHRLRSAFSKCCTDQIHGHSYIIEVFLQAEELNDDGMLIDFGELKGIIGDYINSWDHALVLPKEMPSGGSEVNLIRTDYNPTAEAMACDMYTHIAYLLKEGKHRGVQGLTVSCVRVHETRTGWAEYSELG